MAEIYAEIIGRNLDRSDLPKRAFASITFRSQTPLSKREAIYALDKLFRWQQVKIIPADDVSVKLVDIPKQEL